MKIIITDLTRFANKDIVCVAGINPETLYCHRPLPYLKADRCQELNIQPGAILEGELRYKQPIVAPHNEDSEYNGLKFTGKVSTFEFKEILEKTLSRSVAEGFGISLSSGQKHIPFTEQATCSIITIKVNPFCIRILEDQYKPGKIKICFCDNSGHQFNFISITDRGFYDYAQCHYSRNELNRLETRIQSEDEVYLRIGVGRLFEINGKNGYWFQVNGIYTFPNYIDEIREYN